jgi:hypothetical protein
MATTTTEILASVDDINAELPSESPEAVAMATLDNTDLLQISVARVVRGYLGRLIPRETLMSWSSPDSTPDIIRVIAAKLIASSHYFNQTAKTSLDIDPNSFAQKRYDEAMALLNGILDGSVIIDDGTGGGDLITSDNLTDLDFFPVDETDRAFTLGMEL